MERSRPRNQPTRPLVLLVDDHADTREMYTLALSTMGFDVVPTQDGADAYRRAEDIHPDIIVTDLLMPNGDGWHLLDKLKQNTRTRDIPVVAMSGYLQPSFRARAARDGFAAFFPKPCLLDDLAAGLRDALNGRHPMPRDNGMKQCPRCQRTTLTFARHCPVLTDTATLARTGTDPHDGRERLRYEEMWVCQNPRCNYQHLVSEDAD